MKKFITTLTLFVLAFILFDKLFYIFVYYSAERDADKRLEWVLNGKINKDLIVLGSSIGARDIIASQITEETGLSAYNLSYPGSNVEFHEFILRTLLQFNKAPKIVLLVPDNLTRDTSSLVFRLDRLYPLMKYRYVIHELVNRKAKKNILSYFNLHLLSLSNFDLRQEHFSSLDTIMACGSMPISFQKKGVNWKYNTMLEPYPIEREDSIKVKAFKSIQKLCLQNNIHLILCFPPTFQSYDKLYENRIRDLSEKNTGFFIYDTTKTEIYQNKDYYYDGGHLMRNGAIQFTKEISTYLIAGK